MDAPTDTYTQKRPREAGLESPPLPAPWGTLTLVTPLPVLVTPLSVLVTSLPVLVTSLSVLVTPLSLLVTPLSVLVTPLPVLVTSLSVLVTPPPWAGGRGDSAVRADHSLRPEDQDRRGDPENQIG